MNKVRAGSNFTLNVSATPQQVSTPDPLRAGPSIQNVGADTDILFVYQGPDTPTTSSPAFVLQQYAMIDFGEAAQQQPIWLWGSPANVPTVINRAG
jgi:hypothetical protein